MEITTILGILFIFMVSILLMAVSIGSVSTSLQGSGFVDNETFNSVDATASSAFSIAGGVVPIVLLAAAFLIAVGWWKFG